MTGEKYNSVVSAKVSFEIPKLTGWLNGTQTGFLVPLITKCISPGVRLNKNERLSVQHEIQVWFKLSRSHICHTFFDKLTNVAYKGNPPTKILPLVDIVELESDWAQESVIQPSSDLVCVILGSRGSLSTLVVFARAAASVDAKRLTTWISQFRKEQTSSWSRSQGLRRMCRVHPCRAKSSCEAIKPSSSSL